MMNQPTTIDIELQDYLSQQSITDIRPLAGGHTEAQLYTARDKDQNALVLKVDSLLKENYEVEANQKGYKAIKAEGGAMLIPDPLEFGQAGDRHLIIMRHLGTDLTQADKQGLLNTDSYPQLSQALVTVLTNTIVQGSDSKAQTRGLEAVREQLLKWVGRVPALKDLRIVTLLRRASLHTLASNRSSLMVMDFTPDNTFLTSSGIAIIDPWDQPTYRGSFVPSLAQYLTLVTEVYKLPQATKSIHTIEATIDTVAQLLGLSNRQCQAQKSLGAALQYALSAFVRLNTEPALAQRYANAAEHHMTIVCDIINEGEQ